MTSNMLKMALVGLRGASAATIPAAEYLGSISIYGTTPGFTTAGK